MHKFDRVRKLRAEKKSVSAIARELNLHRDTVRKYLQSNSPPKYKPRETSTRDDRFKNFEARVRSLFEMNKENRAVDVLEVIRDEGYSGSDRTAFRRMAKLLGEKPKERFFEQEYKPGEQTQFDFKESVDLPFVDGPRVVHLHVGSLPFGSTCRLRAYPGKNFECFIDGVHTFFEKIGGMTKNIRFDNLSPCVSKVLRGNARKYTPAFERAAAYYGFGLLPCAPAKGSDKGHVERDIRTWAPKITNAVKNANVVFRDFNHLNEWLDAYVEKRTMPSASESFIEETKHLLPLPVRDDAILCKVDIVQATPYGTVRANRATYSVDDSFIGAMCRVITGPYDTKIFKVTNGLGCSNVITHPRRNEGESSILLEHVIKSLVRKPQAMLRWAHRDVLFPLPAFDRLYKKLRAIDETSAEREFLKTLNLVQHTQIEEIATAVELVLETASESLFQDVKTLLFGERKPEARTAVLSQMKLKPTLSSYDNLIPQNILLGAS